MTPLHNCNNKLLCHKQNEWLHAKTIDLPKNVRRSSGFVAWITCKVGFQRIPSFITWCNFTLPRVWWNGGGQGVAWWAPSVPEKTEMFWAEVSGIYNVSEKLFVSVISQKCWRRRCLGDLRSEVTVCCGWISWCAGSHQYPAASCGTHNDPLFVIGEQSDLVYPNYFVWF